MIIYCLSYAHDIMIWITRSLDLHSDNIITTTTTTIQTADHGRWFLKMSKDEVSAMSLFREFQWSTVRGKNEFLCCDNEVEMFLYLYLYCTDLY